MTETATKTGFVRSPGDAWDEGEPSDWQKSHASEIVAGAAEGAVCILCGRPAGLTMTAPTARGTAPLGLPLCPTCATAPAMRALAERIAADILRKRANALTTAGWETERSFRALYASSARRLDALAAEQGQGFLFREGA